MKVLVIGGGGREHAIVWKIKQSKLVSQIFVAPGNAGMEDIATRVNISELDNEALVAFAKKEDIGLTIVGPDAALGNGVVDAFQKEGLKIFGPDKKAAMIEGSKEFAKDLMKKYNVPTAFYEVFTDFASAKSYCLRRGTPIVIKYDGLAAGKGVTVALDMDTAINALEDIFLNNKFGGSKVVIEDFLDGKEYSLMAFVKGNRIYPMVPAKDHKRAFDNDKGPNTGGMGAFSPVSFVTEEVLQVSMDKIMVPVVEGMIKEGCPFTGVLYAGLILTSEGPKVIEFNARFGDPETEVVLPRMESDMVQVMLDILDDKIVDIKWNNLFTLGVVLASNGYPEKYEKNHLIELSSDLTLFHMGTKLQDGKFYTNGGRVLFVLSQAENLDTAREKAYNDINKVKCDNLFYRHDIGLNKE